LNFLTQVKGTSTVTGKGKANVNTSTPTSAKGRPSEAATSTLTPIPETPVAPTTELSVEEVQNQANEALTSQECSVSQLRVDLELSSDTSVEGSKTKAKPAQQPKLSDVEPSSDEAEAPAQKPKKDKELPTDPTVGVPEIVADFHESIIISEEEGTADQPTPSASATAVPPVPSWMTIPAPVPLVDIHIPLRKPCRPSKPLNPVGKLKARNLCPELQKPSSTQEKEPRR